MSIGNAGSNTTASSNAEISNLLVQGFKAAKEGRRDEAYDIFCNVVRRDPNNELGWLYRAATTQDLSEAYVCLQRVININPANEKAQRGVERIQNRLSADSSNRTSAANGGSTAVGVSPAIAEKDVISDFNQGFSRNPAPDTSSQKPRYPYQETASPFNQAQPAPAPAIENPATPAPYRPSFNQLNNTPGAIDRPPTAQIRASRPTPPPYVPSFTPASEDEVEDDTEGMVDEPVYSAPVGSQRDSTSSRRPHLVEGLASARQRGRAAFGSDTPTDLDRNGQHRSRQILVPLIIVGIVLVIVALIILLLPIFKPASDTATPTSSVAISATTSAATGNTAVATATPGNRPATTGAAGVTVPVVGATTAAASTTSAATTAAAPTTVAATATAAAPTSPTVNATAQAIMGVTPEPATTAAATTAAPAVTTQAPPPATTAPQAPALPRATVYVIKGGDNLTRIASQYSTSIEAIQAANPGLQANTIFAGNRVVVPVSRPDFRGKGAIINAGETLQTIADRYKVSVDDLARFNGYATPADAKPGDAVLVP